MNPSTKAARTTYRPLLIATILISALLSPAVAHAASQAAVDRAATFLQAPKRGDEIMKFMHFGATFVSYSYLRGQGYDDGSFSLIYEFKWVTTDNGYTDVAFYFDSNGNIKSLNAFRTDAIVNQPFVLADLSIKLLGQILIENYKDKLSNDDRRRIQKLVDDADSHALLEWTLRVDQFFGN